MPSPAGLRPAAARPRPLAAVAALLGVEAAAESSGGVVGAAGPQITGVTHDSRAVRPGDLYAALPGSRAHGAEFVGQAVAAGAVAVLTDPLGSERAAAGGLPVLVVAEPRGRLGEVAVLVYDDPARDLLLLGVTGTNGKTTTAYLLDEGLREAGHVTGLIGTVETRIADEVVPSVRTTPEATDLQALLALMRERGVTAVSMEVSSHALALGRVDGTVFDVAGFTNLSQDHLDFHADLEDYYRAKASLFTPDRVRRAVVNVDDDHGRRLAASVAVRVTTVSPSGAADADWRVVDVERQAGASRVVLGGPDGVRLRLALTLPGDFNVANAAVAAAMLVEAGVEPDRVARGVSGERVPGRMERVICAAGLLAVVDYAHTPDAVERAIAALRPDGAGRLVVVLGCGGDRDRDKRPLMGEVAARGADVLVVTDDNPRSEDPAAIRAAMLEGARRVPEVERAELVEVGDRRAAIAEAIRRAGPGDTVLVAGKGHEQSQEVAGASRPFDDRRVLRELAVDHLSGGLAVGDA